MGNSEAIQSGLAPRGTPPGMHHPTASATVEPSVASKHLHVSCHQCRGRMRSKGKAAHPSCLPLWCGGWMRDQKPAAEQGEPVHWSTSPDSSYGAEGEQEAGHQQQSKANQPIHLSCLPYCAGGRGARLQWQSKASPPAHPPANLLFLPLYAMCDVKGG